jgi:hypothetical protein
MTAKLTMFTKAAAASTGAGAGGVVLAGDREA